MEKILKGDEQYKDDLNLQGDLHQSELTVAELEDKIKQLFELKEKYAEAKDFASSLYEQLERDQAMIAGMLENVGLDKYAGQAGTFSYRYESSYLVPKDPTDKAAFFAFLKEKGLFDSMLTVNSMTLNAFCKSEANANNKDEIELPGIKRGALALKVNMRRGNK